MDARQTAEVERLRGQIALDQRRGGDADRLLLSAARRLHTVSAELARATYLDALVAAIWAHDMGSSPEVRAVAEAARTAPPGPVPPRVLDVLLDAVAMRVTEGYAAAAPTLAQALDDGSRAGRRRGRIRALALAGRRQDRPDHCHGDLGFRVLAAPWPAARCSSPARRARSCT